MKDLSNYIYKNKTICPFCNQPIKIKTENDCCGHGDYDTLYSVYCDCAEGTCSHMHLGIIFNLLYPFYNNEDINIILAYINYLNNISKLKERFSNNENK